MVTKVSSSNFTPAVNAVITAAGSIPTISSIVPTNNVYVATGSNVVDPTAPFIKILGSNFASGAQVYIDSTPASSVTFVSSTQLNVTTTQISSGSFVVYVVNPDGSVAIRINGVTYSMSPVWGTSSSLPGSIQGASISIQLAAVSDSSVTYTLASGSLPPGLTLSSSGLLSGTVTGLSSQTTYNFTITATDVETQTNTSSFSITITVTDPYFNQVSLLLNGETSVTPFISDASANNFGLTIAGDIRADKFSPYYNDGYYSVLLSTSGSYLGLSLPALGNLFTIEFWVLPTSAGNNSYYFVGGSASGPLIGYNSTTFSVAHQGAWVLASSTLPTVGVWNHIAVVREGTGTNQFKLYINGVNTATGTEATAFGAQTTGAIGGTSSTSQPSYISNFRIVNNQALYTGTFTPSTSPLTATTVGTTGANVASSLTGTTILLTAQSARFVDKSTNNLTMTPSGTPQVTSAIPFAPNSSYATYGCGYFDGSGDYLTWSSFAPAGNFTFECWFYAKSYPQAQCMLFALPWGGSNFQVICNSDNTLMWQAYTQNSVASNCPITLNQWYHIAVVKNGSSAYTYINGVLKDTSSLTNSISGTALIGTRNDGYNFSGYISDMRLVVGSAVYTTNFTPPTAPLTAVANTQLLTLQYNGGANNSGIIDNSNFNNIITRFGNTTQGTFSPYSQTGYSTYFDGTTYPGFLVNNVTTPLNFAAGQDFTMEFWVYSTSSLADYHLVNYGTYKEAYPSERVILITNKSASIYISAGSNTSATAYTVNYTTLTTNTWNHIAFVRNNNNITVYLNGVSGPTASAPGAAQPLSSRYDLAGPHGLWFGVNTTNWTGFVPVLYTGYMSNFRYVVGTALYTANFTPSTTQLTAITGTQVLTNQNNRLVDNSANALTYTYNGTNKPSIQVLSPFAATGAYTPSVNGGSAYFDGTGDYLSIPPTSLFTFNGDFTIEAWVYPTVINADNCIVSRWTSSLSFIFKIVTSGRPYFAWYKGGTGTVTGTSTAVLTNQWNHVAVTRVGSTVRLFVNGVLDSTTGTIAGALDNSTTAITVGSLDTTPSQVWNGYLSDVRVINGTALYSASFTPPTQPLTSATATPASLLLNFTNGAILDITGRIMFDGSSTVQPQISTSIKKYGSASVACLGGNLMYNTVANSNLVIGTQDFTFEAWIYIVDPNVNGGMINYGTGIGNEQIDFHVYTGTLFPYFAGSARNAGTANTGTWNHYAIVRQSGVSRFYLDGVLNTSIGAVADSTNYTGTVIALGVYQSTYTANCYIDDFRITKGVARYTANFTVPGAMLTR